MYVHLKCNDNLGGTAADIHGPVDFALTATWIGLNVAIVNVGNAVAGPFVGPLLDWTGRKKGLLIGNLLAIVGVFVSGFARNGMPVRCPASSPCTPCYL